MRTTSLISFVLPQHFQAPEHGTTTSHVARKALARPSGSTAVAALAAFMLASAVLAGAVMADPDAVARSSSSIASRPARSSSNLSDPSASIGPAAARPRGSSAAVDPAAPSAALARIQGKPRGATDPQVAG